MTLVLNRRDRYDWARDEKNVYVGRGTPWGNPFVSQKALFVQSSGGPKIKLTCDRTLAVDLYRRYASGRIEFEPTWLDPLLEAEGLVCSCAPLACHAEVLVDLIDAVKLMRSLR